MDKTVGMVSLGCCKNRVDSEVLLGMLRDRGYEIVSDPKKAQIIFINTCGFIEAAKEESIEAILEMAALKKTGRLEKLIVTGCLTQRYPDALFEEMPEVDGFMGVSDYARLFNMLADTSEGRRALYTADGPRFLSAKRVLTTPPYSAYVKISDGCDNRCAYCAIPMIRGPYHSRPYEDIIAECASLVAGGVTELTLIAQDTSRYGNDLGEKKLLLTPLLKEISQMPGLHWLRVLYCYPDTVTDELLDEIAANPKICSYLDLPLQHINGPLLSRMNRRGTPELIRRLISRCRERGIIVRTTMIVGFPGETEEAFGELMDFVKETRFDRLGAFAYSPEEGTAGAEMPQQVDEEIKTRRLDQLMQLQQAISLQINESRVGSECEVLTENVNGLWYTGRSALEAPESDGSILFTSQKAVTPGEYVRVRITGAQAYDLIGEAVCP